MSVTSSVPAIRRVRHRLRTHVSEHPAVYLPFARRKYPGPSPEVIGPVLMGMARPVNVLQQGASVQDVVNLAAMTAVRAQNEIVY